MALADNITAEEKMKIEELRNRMHGLMKAEFYEDDFLFRRFLRARNYDLNDAEVMLKNNMEWRKLNKVDTILTDYTPSEVLEKYYAVSNVGFDKEGSLLVFLDIRSDNVKGLLKCVKLSELIRHMTWIFENDVLKMKKQSAKMGKPMEKFFYIFNLEHILLRSITHKPSLEFLASLLKLFEANYPETLKKAYLVNSPLYFTLAWAVLSPFISAATLEKIKICGKDNWKEELLKHIDSDVLPAFLGGDRTDPDGDPMCKTFIKHGYNVPKHYSVSRTKSDFSKLRDFKQLMIARRSKAEVKLQVPYPDTKVEYEFEVNSKDIEFSVAFKKDQDTLTETEELIPKQRIHTDTALESGVFVCNRPGIYILEFDNTYSWIHHKDIYYTVRVLAPDSQGLYAN